MIELFHSQPSVNRRNQRNVVIELRSLVESISFPREFDSPSNDRARAIICDHFRSIFGKDPQITGRTKNIVMGDPHKASVLVGAHYDSVPGTPGADDNASAVACMLRIAALTRSTENVCFVAFNGEECGLIGSDEFATDLLGNCTSSQLQQVHILEMVGYRSHKPDSQKNPLSVFGQELPTIGNFIGFVANTSALCRKIMTHADTTDIPVIGACIPLTRENFDQAKSAARNIFRSDHASFWKHQVPAVMWTDTAEFRNPHYHQPTDTPDTLDYEFTAAVSDVIAEIINDGQD